MTHAKPKPPTVRLPGHAGVIAMPRPDVISDPHPSAYIAHNAGPQVHLLKDEKHHLEVLQLSNGLQAVPLDDRFGRVTDYLYLGREINLVPGGTIFYLQATDLIDGHTTFVNMGTKSGHLSLSEIRIGNTVQQGFKGVDDIGPVFIPVVRRSQRLQVNPVVYRTDRLSSYKSSSSSRFYSPASVDDSPFYQIVS